MGCGVPQSKLPQHRRVARIGEEIAAQLKNEKWLLQILLLEPNIVAASFIGCA